MLDYDWIYQLEPLYEDLEHSGPGWYRLKWKPIKNGTYNIRAYKSLSSDIGFGVRTWSANAHNGWHRGWDGRAVEFWFGFFIVSVWAIWNISVYKDGPSDLPEKRRPLDLSKLEKQ